MVEDLLAALDDLTLCSQHCIDWESQRCTGFDHPVNLVVEDLLAALDDPALPLLQWGDRFSAAAARLPPRLADQLEVGGDSGDICIHDYYQAAEPSAR